MIRLRMSVALWARPRGPARPFLSDRGASRSNSSTGPSGAARLRSLRMLFLSLRPTRGLITMFDEDIATSSKDGRSTLRGASGSCSRTSDLPRPYDRPTKTWRCRCECSARMNPSTGRRSSNIAAMGRIGRADGGTAACSFRRRKQRAGIARAVIGVRNYCLPTSQLVMSTRSRPEIAAAVHRMNKSGTFVRDRHARYRLDGRVRRTPTSSSTKDARMSTIEPL